MKAKGTGKHIGGRPDLATIGGLTLAIGGILAGLVMEGGKVQDVAQVTAAMIVFLGTLGAVMVTTPVPTLLRAFRRVPEILFYRGSTAAAVIEELITYAAKARKEGIVSLETEAEATPDRFLRKGLSLAVDGVDLEQIRKILHVEIAVHRQLREAEARVFEAAGGYAPTIGIVGAILGLIQVMKNLANIDEVGRGIAVAFVATIYGVASANIVFLPVANKLRARLQAAVEIQELTLEGVLSIAEGMHPKLIRNKLEAYLQGETPPAKKPAKSSQPDAVAAEV